MLKQTQTKFCGKIFTEHICSVGVIYSIRLMVMNRIRITFFGSTTTPSPAALTGCGFVFWFQLSDQII
jgi:hypothetical protein